jgi:exopolysaccharide biosynthesis operon protein EpsL
MRFIANNIVSITVLISLSSNVLGDITPFISFSSIVDSNIYKRDKKSDNFSATSKDDVIIKTTAGLNLDLQVSKQKFIFSGQVSKNNFDKNKQLDNFSNSLSARWNWLAGRNLSGVFAANNHVSLANFANTTSLKKNQQTERNIMFSSNWRYHPAWKIGGYIGLYNYFYNLNDRKEFDLRQHITTIDLTYLTKIGNKVGLKFNSILGGYPNRIITNNSFFDNQFDQKELSLFVLWKASTKSVLNYSLGLVSRKHPNFDKRDFNGFEVDIGYDWRLKNRLLISLQGYQKIIPSNTNFASYLQNTGFDISSIWSLTEKLKLTLLLGSKLHKFLGNPNPVDINNNFGEAYNNYSLNIGYKPYRNVDLEFNYSFNDRDSNLFLRNYESNLIRLSLIIKF